ncbi:nucleoside triphosphate pyrophosphohydrolase family protein [Chitinophaga sancti]|uniref:MazG nucleotide pyrophosphohydrolase domain-containing protein n=1 Tax=Chitinophaga sancti TaxID=1004 RepID=A0A1K1LLP1_9BACT|nr:nucleoside triphosphate pyrophosphohydrolase family protein [Chitinophaga sancti]WQD65046.1 nucleoside triphosphate pyrophosphohydrolase family protein [Chitinophaga sancti]WQG89330.1 nucleoside triphosphate pyrophosphohydrolase family protein [Chitinophaga sancti]SFW11763.1 MazG nucleotide pyrophosphohydrolase domain-containing protein [Chitinophaga sancti]
MDFNSYQEKAKETIQRNASDDKLTSIVPFLGIIGEIGSLVTELKKKFRDGDAYVAFKTKLEEELGDVLWYISTIATQNNLILEDIASKNLTKIHDRFLVDDSETYKDFDNGFPEHEKLPDEFEIEFISYEEIGKKKLKIIDKRSNEIIGDPLTDNSYIEDGYRFHDIFHYGYLAILGWSPVLRKLLALKRKSNADIDENEDGARAQIIEEMVSLYIYSLALDHELLKYSNSVDSGIIKQVKILIGKLEVKDCSGKQWEKAILNSYEIYNKLRDNDGGRVLVSKKNRTLTYLGKK